MRMAMKRDARRGDAFTERVVHRLRGDLNALEGSKLAELAPKGLVPGVSARFGSPL